MVRARVAQFALAILTLALLWMGILFASQREITLWTEFTDSDGNVTSEGTSVEVFELGVVLLAIGLLATVTILVFEAYIRPARQTLRSEVSSAEALGARRENDDVYSA